MSMISDELGYIFEKIKGNKKILQFSEHASFHELKKICDASGQMVSVLEFDVNSYSLIYPNKGALDFLGIKKEDFVSLGFEFVLKTTHPDNLDSVYMLIKFFNDANNRQNTFTHTLCLNTRHNGWQWIYSMVRPATFHEDGSVKYLIAIACVIDDLLDTSSQSSQTNQRMSLYEENICKYNSLTGREKEVLQLIAMELSSREIADKLFISPLTVDTHRKHLIEKLGVKSSIGLIKYAILFNLV